MWCKMKEWIISSAKLLQNLNTSNADSRNLSLSAPIINNLPIADAPVTRDSKVVPVLAVSLTG